MRDDIEGIPLMKKNGFTVDYSSADAKHNRLEHPHDCVGFTNGNFGVWRIYERVLDEKVARWQTARIISGGGLLKYYRHHHPVNTLQEAIDHMIKTNDEYDTDEKLNQKAM